MDTTTFKWENTKQLTLLQILMATFIPSAVAFTGFRFVLPMVVANGLNSFVAWLLVAIVMLAGFVTVAIYLLAKEAKELNISIKERMCLKRLSRKQILIYGALLLVALIVSSGTTGLNAKLSEISFLNVPEYFPFFLNPAIDPMVTSPALLTPGLTLSGSYYIIPLLALALLLNILTEELFFRAWMLPKMTRLKSKSWIVNGLLFASYHTCQLWLFPQILVTSLFFSFSVYKTKSIWPAFIMHLVANTLSVASIFYLVMN